MLISFDTIAQKHYNFKLSRLIILRIVLGLEYLLKLKMLKILIDLI